MQKSTGQISTRLRDFTQYKGSQQTRFLNLVKDTGAAAAPTLRLRGATRPKAGEEGCAAPTP